ncbi:MAG: aldehyde dehydrogenase family protein [Clostridia bacterium]|jgi:sulfoacetaldehyde dehydrogenase|nr:aldehyde dehydrogenase family protein [Clostridia bacterium]MDX9871145.1 aldehyde dehydrogenase family protein [Clostridia bacterium]
MSDAKEYVAGLVKRAKEAQKTIEYFTQEQVDELAAAVAWSCVKDGPAQEIAKMAVEESRMGYYDAKYAKLMTKVKGALRDMKGQKSVGVIERDDAKGLIKIAKPVGVIGCIIPCTNPEATPVVKAIWTLKTRNAAIFAPHPRTKNTNTLVVNTMRATLKKFGVSEDLLIGIEEPSMEITQELMKQCDLILATGGGGLVKEAYSSGTPAYGVGQGNASVIVDETADLKEAANKLLRSKTFDYATSCSAENSMVIQEGIYDEFVGYVKAEGGYVVSPEEKAKLLATMWPDGSHLNTGITAQPVEKIAEMAGIKIPEGTKFLVVEETGIGPAHPFSGEKLSVVVTFFKYKEFSEAIEKVNQITQYHGRGHSSGIHSAKEDRIIEYGLKTKVSRIMVNQPQCLANSGAWTNSMPMSMTLGCGKGKEWGGNISSENMSWHHLMNVTWISFPHASNQPTDEDLFGKEIMAKY